MFSAGFWKDAGERAVKTGAQAALLVLGADQLDAIAADWGDVGSFALGGVVLSLLTSIVSAPIGPEEAKGTPSVL
jgi:Putative lactococcus lactis phage r1t holin